MPATETYTPIGTFTTTSAVSEVVFGGISQDYKDLVLVTNVVASTVGPYDQGMIFNGDSSGSAYSSLVIRGAGSSAGIYVGLENTAQVYLDFYGSATTTQRASSIIHIFDYSVDHKHKNVLTRGNRANSGSELIASRWKSNSPIYSISYFLIGGTIGSGTTLTLYGIAG